MERCSSFRRNDVSTDTEKSPVRSFFPPEYGCASLLHETHVVEDGG